MVEKYKRGVSICLTAYNEEKYIEEALDSIKNQTWFKKHNNYEILLGIDCHYGTLKKVQEIRNKYHNLRVFMMNKNGGTYIATNTMMTIAQYDVLIRFDSDDVMLPNMVETIMNNIDDVDVVRFQMKNFGRRSGTYMACGQIAIKHDVFDKFGGYQPWTCSADSELEERLLKFAKIKKITEVLFNRRIHTNNLTVAKETNFSSKVRRENLLYVTRLKRKLKTFEDAYVKRVTGEYTEIFEDSNIEEWDKEMPKAQQETIINNIPKNEKSTKDIEALKQRFREIHALRNSFGNNSIYS